MTREAPTGLYAHDLAIPLVGVRIDARLVGLATAVTVTQRYVNRETVPVEAVYVFPLEEGAAVSGFAARVGDRVIEGRVEERDAAFAAYDDAMADGHGAFLLDQERPNVFTASIGNLAPGQQVDIELRYVALATREGAATRLMIPTTVSPRYVPAQAADALAPVEIGQPDGERVNPEHRFAVPYGLTLTVDVTATSAVSAVESPSHPLRTRLRDHGATVELAHAEAALDRDFVLLVETATPFGAHALVAREDDGTRVCMVLFAPDPAAAPESGHEILFLLDCSGSMAGDSMVQARRALELCVRALAPEDTFNVTRFGSSHVTLWSTPRPLTDATLDEAVAWVRAANADLGGTEVLAPLAALVGAAPDPKRPRQVLLLTDGEVSNEAEVIALAEAHAHQARVFTFGIGAGASEHLVRGVARASRGAAEFIFPGERIEPKVLRAFNRVRTPGFTDVRVDWGGLEVEQAPRDVPPVFAGDFVTVFARVRAGETHSATLLAGGQRWEVAIDLEHAPLGGPLPTLWARHALRDLEAGPTRGSNQRRPGSEDAQRARVIALAKRYGLMSAATSYVAVEVRAEADKTTTPAALRRIPVALTTGWGGHGSVFGAAGVGLPPGVPPPPAPSVLPSPYGPGTTAIGQGQSLPTAVRTSAVVGRGGPSGPMPARARNALGAVADLAKGALVAPAAGIKALASLAKGAFGGHPYAEADEAAPEAAVSPPADRELADCASGDDRLYALLATQRADGSFRASSALRTWLGAAAAAFDAAIAAHGEALVTTTVTLALFARDEATREPEWRPAAQKARRWLAKQPVPFDAATVLG